MSENGRRLRDEEAALWQRISRDVTPLPRVVAAPEEAEALEEEIPPPPPPKKVKARAKRAPAASPEPPRPPTLPELDPVVPAGVDRRTARRLKRGQLPAEARLDLHGRTQDQAHDALQSFIQESRMARRRCVLVITGKGSIASGKGGVLRQMVPRWLNEPALRQHIIAITNAPESSGGAGALYVLLKSREPLERDRAAG
ncbi:MAG: Smr/MutS family protein [Rhodospirillales bacterium]|nr:Smr/MutS family protein [Rhodospirillales bacterium]